MTAAADAAAQNGPRQTPAVADGQNGRANDGLSIALIDLSVNDEELLAEQIAEACSTVGFFQIIRHGIPQDLIDRFRCQSRQFFALPYEQKLRLKRNENNARGYFDDELTKQRRDWKEAFDFGVPRSRTWDNGEGTDASLENRCLDGYNQFPPADILPDFRSVVTEYFDACASLSDRLARLMVRGLDRPGVRAHGDRADIPASTDPIVDDLRRNHSSYLRMNYYPPCSHDQFKDHSSPLGISPHYDAGFLTVLLQDDDCHSLQVQSPTDTTSGIVETSEWITVHPQRGALTINTGDMAQVWSNGRYKAPLHRVLTSSNSVRYSAPFFYNPSYQCLVQPANTPVGFDNGTSEGDERRRLDYHPVSWGYFRALRFAGDLTDLGVEIQISHFRTDADDDNGHLQKQRSFLNVVDFDEPFSVEKHRALLTS